MVETLEKFAVRDLQRSVSQISGLYSDELAATNLLGQQVYRWKNNHICWKNLLVIDFYGI